MARAVRFDEFGEADVLKVVDVDVPAPGDGEVRVTVKAAGINPGEASIRKGLLEAVYPTTLPSGEGSDFAGVVDSVGAGVDGVSVGDEVLGWSDTRSSHAEVVVVPADQVLPKPPSVSWEAAGSLSVIGTTAYAAVDAVGAGSGDTVVVSAAAGGVGSLVVQLLTNRGARVIGIASKANADWLQSKDVTPVAYGDGLADRIRGAAPDGVDAFIDCFGPDYLDLAVELGVRPERINTIISFEKAGQIGAKAEGGSAVADPAQALTEIADLIAAGRVEVPIAATYPLQDVQAAFRDVEQRHTRGKIVLIP
jgi:NADPH:quinone reductase